MANIEQALTAYAVAHLVAIQGKLAAEHAHDDSDDTLARILSPCAGSQILPAAIALRDAGYDLLALVAR